MGAQLPVARHSGAHFLPPTQAAGQPGAERQQVFLHCGRFGTAQRPLLAGQGDEHHQPALAAAEFPQEMPFFE